MRKQAIVILSRYLWPVDGGRKESLNHYLKELYDNYNYNITVLCFLEADQKVSEGDKPYYISKVQTLEDVGVIEKAKNILCYSLFRAQWPLQCSMYYSKKNAATISMYCKQLKPDLILTEMIRTCIYYDSFKDSHAKKLANLDDLLSTRYERQLLSKNSNANFMGAYGGKLPEWINKITSGKFVRTIVLKMESRRCRKWEDIFYQKYDYTLMTSNVERDILNRRMKGNKAKTLTVGVDCDYYGQPIKTEKDPIGLSYVGNLYVASNADTLKMIIEKILPLLKSDYRLYVIGKCSTQIKERYGSDKIIFCGRVDDLREYVKRAVVFFSPIAYGTGVKTKIVEAMAMGMPVVTNSVGIEGIHAKQGEDILVSDDYGELAKCTDRLLCDMEYREIIGNNARLFANMTFRWEKVFEVYKEMGL